MPSLDTGGIPPVQEGSNEVGVVRGGASSSSQGESIQTMHRLLTQGTFEILTSGTVYMCVCSKTFDKDTPTLYLVPILSPPNRGHTVNVPKMSLIQRLRCMCLTHIRVYSQQLL